MISWRTVLPFVAARFMDRQFFLGPFFLPAYFVSSYLAWRRGEHFYLDNRFEREAYRLHP